MNPDRQRQCARLLDQKGIGRMRKAHGEIHWLITLLAGLIFALPATASTANGMLLFDAQTMVSIRYDSTSGTPIAMAAAMLSHDLSALSGRTPAVSADLKSGEGPGVIIGLTDSPGIAALLKANHIDAGPIRGKWETYGRAVIPAPWNPAQKALLIFGSDARGTIWGVVGLTREMGVSAWEWWADVKIQPFDHMVVDGATHYSKEPSVRYRDFFLNTTGLARWAGKTFDPASGNIDPKAYARVVELMWRLKANMLWPAMSEKDRPFNAIPANYDVARDYSYCRSTASRVSA
jgi:hypothetical protein